MKQSNKITFIMRILLRILFITLYTVFSMRLQEEKKRSSDLRINDGCISPESPDFLAL